MDAIITPKKKMVRGLSLYWVKYIIPITAPNPYIGQYGPIRKPLSTIFFSRILEYIDSVIQPNTEYIKNKIMYLYNKFILSPFFCSISLILILHKLSYLLISNKYVYMYDIIYMIDNNFYSRKE